MVLHGKKRTGCSGLMKTALNNVVLPTLFNVVNTELYYIYLEIGLLYFRESKTYGQKHGGGGGGGGGGGRWAVDDVKRVILRSPPWL